MRVHNLQKRFNPKVNFFTTISQLLLSSVSHISVWAMRKIFVSLFLMTVGIFYLSCHKIGWLYALKSFVDYPCVPF